MDPKVALYTRLLAFAISLLLAFCSTAAAQTYKVLHNFCAPGDPGDGWGPPAGLTPDTQGNLYGVTFGGGLECNIGGGYGTVFQLVPNQDGSWTENILYAFNVMNPGPLQAPVALDTHGNVYGLTSAGVGYGSVFELQPGSGMWSFEQLHRFDGTWDGGFDTQEPYGGVIVAGNGRLYGTTQAYGNNGGGVAFSLSEVSPLFWYELVLHPFAQAGSDGAQPQSAATIGPDGNLYGTTFAGGSNNSGTVYRLTPNLRNFGWTESVLYSFQGTSHGSGSDGANPAASVIFDALGNIYGTTSFGGPAGAGTVYKLTPNLDGTWTESVLYAFRGGYDNDGIGPQGPVALDRGGNLYGTTIGGGSNDDGTVYELTPSPGGQWTETILHSFSGQDGQWPRSGLVIDAAGNLYGTTQTGGTGGVEHGGVAFEITP